MHYPLKQIHCRPWTLNGLSLNLIESHYENHYGGALRRLNAITQQLEALDFDKTPGYVVDSLKRAELIALTSTLRRDMYEHADHIDFGANARAYIDAFQRNIDWPSVEVRYQDASRVEPPRPLVQKEFGDVPAIAVEDVKAMLDAGERVQVIDARPR